MLRHVSSMSRHISVHGLFFPTSMSRHVNKIPRHIRVYHSGSSWMSRHMTPMPQHVNAYLSSVLSSCRGIPIILCLLYLLLAPKCLFFIMIFVKRLESGIMINSQDLVAKFALKAQNECIRCAQKVCNFTPNTLPSIFQ